ncbi:MULTISPECIES: hypothetical protein [Streptomyces violaceusniger group]|uniref:Uncharacterized protein n=2 Tax=Streptomyces javensis TaxID=114698 RepID=A0ABS0RG15_9ACTN|nr:hypothetical protein [Streptomyces javensis]MBI0316326.1 hypothetical protein [Streptomyces javensis]
MTAARGYSDLYGIIERLEPEQVEELRRHALRLVKTPPPSRFRVLGSFDGRSDHLGVRAKDIAREEFGEADADRCHRPYRRPAEPERSRP